MNKRVAVCVALLGVVSPAGCRVVSLCEGDPECIEGDRSAGNGGAASNGAQSMGGGAATGAEAGVPPTAGEGGAAMCAHPLESCDHTHLNGCETDLWSDPDHCGACELRCEGVCSRRGCHKPETLSERPITPLTRFAVTTEYLYFLSGESPASPARLLRSDRLGFEPQVLAENLPYFTGLAVAAGRIYLWGGGENLWSGTDAQNLVDEGFPVGSLTESAGVIYADRQGTIVSRSAGDTTWTPRPWLADEDRAAERWLADASGTLALLRMSGDDSSRKYELFLVESPHASEGGVVAVASGTGTPVRLRATGIHVYWLVEDASGTCQLWRVETPSGRLQLLATERGATDFAIDAEFVYLTRTLFDDSGYEIEAIPIYDIWQKLRLGADLDMLFPEAVGEYLWFFADERLRRVDLQVGAL